MSNGRAPFDESALRARRPVWVALSELFLDTELDDAALADIVRVMAESTFSIEELRDIYYVEVAPVAGPNTRMTAGVWQGFDPDALCARIVENLTLRPGRTAFFARFFLTRWWWTGSEVHFASLLDRVRAARAAV
jgi:hypothetical protein